MLTGLMYEVGLQILSTHTGWAPLLGCFDRNPLRLICKASLLLSLFLAFSFAFITALILG